MANGICDRCGNQAIALFEDTVPIEGGGIKYEKICDVCMLKVEQTVEGTLPPGSPPAPGPGANPAGAVARALRVKIMIVTVKAEDDIEEPIARLEKRVNDFIADLDTTDVDVDIQYQSIQGVEGPGMGGGITPVNEAGQMEIRPIVIFNFVVKITWR